MTEQAVTTEEVLAEVAAATADVPKKVRTAKHDPEGGQVLEMPKKARKPREPKAPKLYAQLAEDGTPLLGEDGEPVMGPNKPPKPPKPKKEPKLDAEGNPIVTQSAGKAVVLLHGDQEVSVKGIQNTATIVITKDLGSREGSKRAERAKAFEGSEFVADFLAKEGALRDLYRHLRSGAVELHIDGQKLSVKE